MAHWIRFEHEGERGFGALEGDAVAVHRGDLFAEPQPTGKRIPLGALRMLTPCQPAKFLALWNNYHALAEKTGQAVPKEPLYFIKAASSYCAHEEPIRAPASYDGRVVYEGELGIVIGKRAKAVCAADAPVHVFGYTCINDVTALDIFERDPAFAQWTRAKSYDSFGVFGPSIATGLDPAALVVKTRVGGRERQNYPCSDMIFSPAEIVSRLSQDMTLEPGDLIACGTSVGVGPLRKGAVVEVEIEGIGVLRNAYE